MKDFEAALAQIHSGVPGKMILYPDPAPQNRQEETVPILRRTLTRPGDAERS